MLNYDEKTCLLEVEILCENEESHQPFVEYMAFIPLDQPASVFEVKAEYRKKGVGCSIRTLFGSLFVKESYDEVKALMKFVAMNHRKNLKLHQEFLKRALDE